MFPFDDSDYTINMVNKQTIVLSMNVLWGLIYTHTWIIIEITDTVNSLNIPFVELIEISILGILSREAIY